MNQPLPQFIHPIVDRLRSLEGIVAISLGCSRARGNHTPKSDVDLELYYQSENSISNGFALRPADYQRRVQSVFAFLAVGAESIRDAIAILDEIERELSQWYGDRRLVV